MRIAASKAGDEPIPGYTLRKRLGAGGYGEVWLADAPGGLHKAIKLVFGAFNESHAASELKSLDRIRKLNHPFLLSLERIEIVDNQVVIVTELAESSLLDRFQHFRRLGQPGIPRGMLLEFLRDTADALDFLSQKHFLQHLDVKPGNLLIVADRIKVGDFGLVKDLHDQNQSLIGGLTPTYSAPEIFDGRPDFRSDQYSLAIVYMEMLTGQLPFSGKATGELARQHLNQPPELEALPPADRAVVARALSKNPLDRFASCRALIDQLQKNRGSAVPILNQSAGQPSTGAELSSRPANLAGDEQSGTTQNPDGSSTAATLGVRHQFHDRLPIESVQSNWKAPRCLFIGVGGTGCRALLALRKNLAANVDAQLAVEEHGWLAIDTTAETLSQITLDTEIGHLPAQQAIQLPIYGPATYRKLDPGRFAPLSRRWLYNIPKSRTTDGVRPLAILSLLHHYEAVSFKIKAQISRLLEEPSGRERQDCEPIRIYVLSSMHGGTGSGLIFELGFIIRQAFRDFSRHDYRLAATATAAMTVNHGQASLPAAAAMSCLSEMAYYMSGANEVAPICLGEQCELHNSRRPFDWITLVDGGFHGNRSEAIAAAQRVANFVFVDSQTLLGGLMSEDRVAHDNGNSNWLRAGCADRISTLARVDEYSLARWCSEQSLMQVATYMLGPRDKSPNSEDSQSESSLLPTASGDLPLTNQASEEFTRRLLRDLGVIETQMHLNEITANEEGDKLLGRWARRLTSSQQLIQMRSDIAIWKDSISRIVQMRVYNWHQVEQIQLNVIEGLLDFCDHRTHELARLFEPFSHLFGSPEQIVDAASDYLKRFAENCFQLLEVYRREGNELARKLNLWCNTVSAERAQHHASIHLSMVSLPIQLQTVATRVMAVLNSALNTEVMRILDRAVDALMLDSKRVEPIISDRVDLRYIITLATDLVRKLSDELEIDIPKGDQPPEEESLECISFGELTDYHPVITQQAGMSHRFVISPLDRLPAITDLLKQECIAEHTTCIPSTESMGLFGACESSQVAMPHIVSSLWRPSPATIQLAERLHTRVDIDWDPIGRLLESVGPTTEGQAAPAVDLVPFETSLGTTPIHTDAH